MVLTGPASFKFRFALLFVSHDGDVVGVAFSQAGLGDADESAAGTELGNIGGPGLPHSRTKATSHLADEVRD